MSQKFTVKIQKRALDELRHIYHFISEIHPLRAQKFIKELKEKIKSLKIFPFRGSVCNREGHSLLQEVRLIPHKGYAIVYEIENQTVTVYRIMSPGQNWRPLLIPLH